MMAPVAVAMDKGVPLVQPDLEPPVPVACLGCESRWPPVSSCSSKNRTAARQHHRRDAWMALLSPPEAVVKLPLEEPKPLLLFPVLPPLPHQHPGVQASDLDQALVVSAGLDGLTGMTAPNWKRCAVNRLRNSAKRFTSSAKTMMP